jgi:hypothetical protein
VSVNCWLPHVYVCVSEGQVEPMLLTFTFPRDSHSSFKAPVYPTYDVSALHFIIIFSSFSVWESYPCFPSCDMFESFFPCNRFVFLCIMCTYAVLVCMLSVIYSRSIAYWNRYSAPNILATLRDLVRFDSLYGHDFCLNVTIPKTGSGACHQCAGYRRIFLWREDCWGLKLTAVWHFLSMLRMHGAEPALPHTS